MKKENVLNKLEGCKIEKYLCHFYEHNKNDCIDKLYSCINFPCKFDKDGKCKGRDSFNNCCCDKCVEAKGYLEYNKSKEEIKIYKKYWNNETGFYNKNSGCSLPIHLRSSTCVSYLCEFAKKEIDEKSKKIFNVLKVLIRINYMR
jgi:hypothetical protein